MYYRVPPRRVWPVQWEELQQVAREAEAAGQDPWYALQQQGVQCSEAAFVYLSPQQVRRAAPHGCPRPAGSPAVPACRPPGHSTPASVPLRLALACPPRDCEHPPRCACCPRMQLALVSAELERASAALDATSQQAAAFFLADCLMRARVANNRMPTRASRW